VQLLVYLECRMRRRLESQIEIASYLVCSGTLARSFALLCKRTFISSSQSNAGLVGGVSLVVLHTDVNWKEL